MSLSVCFICTTVDFDALTPLEVPLGGSQSSMAYLAVELAKRGHRVTMLTAGENPRSVLGVEAFGASARRSSFFTDRQFDVIIVLNGPADLGVAIKKIVPATKCLLWTQHASDQPAMSGLAETAIREAWDEIVCASAWHRSDLMRAFGLVPHLTSFTHNGIGPSFENLFSDRAALAAAKAGPPVCAYTSVPFRGLHMLLPVFPLLRSRWPALRLDVYSGMYVHRLPDGEFGQLYDRARTLDGVTYRGAVAQPALATGLRSALLLTYPNTYPETFCISTLEAMAAGAYVVTSDLGALPETTFGLAHIVPGALVGADPRPFAAAFARATDQALTDHASNPATFLDARFSQVQEVNTHTWRRYAIEWETRFIRLTQ